DGRAKNALPIQIKIKEGERAVRVKQYPLKKEDREGIGPIIENFLQIGLLKECQSDFNTPILPVKKPDGSYRLVQDLRAVNRVTEDWMLSFASLSTKPARKVLHLNEITPKLDGRTISQGIQELSHFIWGAACQRFRILGTSARRRTGYRVSQKKVQMVRQTVIYLDGSMGEPVIHDCLETIEATYSSRPDLKDIPLEGAETWFTDGSSYVISGKRHAGYVVPTSRKVIGWTLISKHLYTKGCNNRLYSSLGAGNRKRD
ncbi:hypothetical protein DV515_00010657, partial [Chloebia gouldiae]